MKKVDAGRILKLKTGRASLLSAPKRIYISDGWCWIGEWGQVKCLVVCDGFADQRETTLQLDMNLDGVRMDFNFLSSM